VYVLQITLCLTDETGVGLMNETDVYLTKETGVCFTNNMFD